MYRRKHQKSVYTTGQKMGQKIFNFKICLKDKKIGGIFLREKVGKNEMEILAFQDTFPQVR